MEGLNNRTKFTQENSPDGGFLQSEEWRKFQESAGRTTFHVKSKDFWANIIEHKLPVVGKYFYVPRGPVIPCNMQHATCNKCFDELISLAKKNDIGWVRIEPQNDKILEFIKECFRQRRVGLKIQKAPYDMQPREILVIDITKSEEELLAEMKPKTRYNIKLSQKHNIFVKVISNFQFSPKCNELTTGQAIYNKIPNFNDQNSKFYVDKFIELVKVTAKRDRITPHSESYYRKMFEIIPADIFKLYVAEYEGKIIAANIVIFYGNTATYLHGASDYNYRNAMAPYLLQWQAIRDAKEAGVERYDLGGVRTENQKSKIKNQNNNAKLGNENIAQDTKYKIPDTSWSGITRFKTGFAPNTKPIIFPGSYDIVINLFRYNLYRVLQKVKSIF